MWSTVNNSKETHQKRLELISFSPRLDLWCNPAVLTKRQFKSIFCNAMLDDCGFNGNWRLYLGEGMGRIIPACISHFQGFKCCVHSVCSLGESKDNTTVNDRNCGLSGKRLIVLTNPLRWKGTKSDYSSWNTYLQYNDNSSDQFISNDKNLQQVYYLSHSRQILRESLILSWDFKRNNHCFYWNYLIGGIHLDVLLPHTKLAFILNITKTVSLFFGLFFP